MIEASLDSLSLLYGLIITQILKACVLSIFVKQCYNAISFANMGCILVNDVCVDSFLSLKLHPSPSPYS